MAPVDAEFNRTIELDAVISNEAVPVSEETRSVAETTIRNNADTPAGRLVRTAVSEAHTVTSAADPRTREVSLRDQIREPRPSTVTLAAPVDAQFIKTTLLGEC